MAATTARGETVSGYFRKVFQDNPRLLEGRSNQELLDRWLKDHPDAKEVPGTVKKNLANVKSLLRQEARRKKGGRPTKNTVPSDGVGVTAAAPARHLPTTTAGIEDLTQLEEKIDDCLSMAKYMDAEGLQDVISLLRRAATLSSGSRANDVGLDQGNPFAHRLLLRPQRNRWFT